MEQWRIEEPTSLDLHGVRRLNVRIVGGSVDVVGRPEESRATPGTGTEPTASGDESTGDVWAASTDGGSDGRSDGSPAGEAHLEVSDVRGILLVTLDNGTLTITHERLTWGGLLDWVDRREVSVIVSVAVPQSCPVELGVVSADAVVSGIHGSTTVKSVSGDLTLDGVRADISAQTVSGDLESRGLTGALRFTTVSGDLTVVDGTSGSVRAETVSGQVTLDLDVPTGGRVDLSSVSGDMTVRLPEAAGLHVEVKTMSGDLDSAFSGVSRERRPGRNVLRGTVGQGNGHLRAKTVSGDVTLLRRDTA